MTATTATKTKTVRAKKPAAKPVVTRKPGSAAGREIKLTAREEGGVKECSRCHTDKPATAEHFYVRPNGTLNAHCRPCNAKMGKAYVAGKAKDRAGKVSA